MPVNALELIGAKRDGGEHTPEEIGFLLRGYLEGSIPDYQMSAWLMAVCTRGMTARETLELTRAMVASGETLDLSAIPGVKVDKHSTGGVGDKVTLVAVPLAAACGVPVPKLSGRALAHTGGTLDKLESVPGVRVELEPGEFMDQVRRIGLAVAAQSPRMVPADRALYALRDVSATVPSIPLIASSVMSKKLAAGADVIVLDVKFGRGAFMPDASAAVELAEAMVAIGEGAGRRTVALITAMDNPLGRTVGNALEVLEALEVLAGRGDPELTEVCVAVAAEMCALAGVSADPAAAIRGGAAEGKLWEMLEAQGGSRLRPPLARPAGLAVCAPASGWVQGVDALACGLAVIELGGGRTRKQDRIDHGVGLSIEAGVGERVDRGQPLVRIHAASEEAARRAEPRLLSAWTIASEEVERPPHVRHRVDRDGAHPASEPSPRA
ncbi:thymidine phosphorylase [Candidatus Nephthysia bennettiae]|uniref:thymidine phosphorylase n=1 Tax=Candidatus Nephthysia bennettiae TaxID=3127016 RepID=UPI0030C6FE15